MTRLVRDLSFVVIDEHMNAYQTSEPVKKKSIENGNTIPLVYIPRKPHPNGLLVYLLVTYTTHPIRTTEAVPYILDFLPHLKVGDVSPTKALCEFIDRKVSIQ